MKHMYFVYILRCGDGSLYTGIARNVAERIARHQVGKGSRYVRSRGVGEVAYVERKRTVGLALKREREIKSWSRSKKLALINQ